MTKTSEARSAAGSLFTGAFSTFSVDDLAAARAFYRDTLGLGVTEEDEGLSIEAPGGTQLFLYPKEDHKSATFTVFNLMVDDIQKAVDELASRGIEFLAYDEPMKTDEQGIYWGADAGDGPNIAWFTDAAGNILSVIEN